MAASDILQAIVALAVFVFCIVVHENAHGIVAEYFGDPTARQMGRITMNPLPHVDPFGSVIIPLIAYFSGMMFGWAKPVPVNSANLRNPVVHNAYVAAAGPASNFLLAILGTLLYIIVILVYQNVDGLEIGRGNTFLFFKTICKYMIQINCILAIFNLLPIPPLDGHWILMRYLPEPYRGMLASIRPYGFMILIVLMMTRTLGMLIGPPYMFIVNGLYKLIGLVVTL